MAVTAKERNRDRLLRYLSDPDNDWLDRKTLAVTVLGYKHSQSIWTVFTGAELDQIEREALDNRRKRYASMLARADMGILRAAASGDARAAKLCYQRFEGWTEKTDLNLTGRLEIENLSHEEIKRRIAEHEARRAKKSSAG
jgi:hypothetical protein